MFFSQFNHFHLNMLLRRHTCFFLNHVTEIIGREIDFIRKVFHGRQAILHRKITSEIFLQKLLKLGKRVFIDAAPGDELAFIEPHTVIEQKLDIHSNQCFTMLIDRMLQLNTDLYQAIHHSLFFLIGQVQSLAY